MPRATCRCGHDLVIPADPTERVKCPGCGAKVRIRRPRDASSSLQSEDGYIRFFCPCGRRLKVDGAAPPPHGKCPDCGVIVPVPTTSLTSSRPPGHPESPTEELAATDRDAIARWSAKHREQAAKIAVPPATTFLPTDAPPPQYPQDAEDALTPTMAFTLPPSDKVEVGLRICPRCGQPVPMGSATCRNCGTPVPRR